MNKLISLDDLFKLKIASLLNSERQIAAGYPILARNCSSVQLQAILGQRTGYAYKRSLLLEMLLPGTEGQVEGPSPVKAILEEGNHWIQLQEESLPAVLDATIASIISSIGHLNIANYGSAHCYASLLNRQDTLVFYQLLQGEVNADRELSRLIEVILNPQAAEAGRKKLDLVLQE